MAGIPPDLGETERELLERAFDALASVVQTEPARVANDVVATSDVGGKSSTTTATTREQPSYDYKGVKSKQQLLARRQQQQEEQTGRTNGSGGGGDENPNSGTIEAPRILPSEIIRLLRAGAVEEFRRASPALSAACIYQEFAEGLEGAVAAHGRHGIRRNSPGSSTDEDDHPAGDRRSNEGETRRQHDEAHVGCNGCDGQGWGISKEEFCDYFEAVTDLVDLNGLSLLPPAKQSLVQPAAVSV